eukprot:Sspe_Gene.26014::Locus_10615_Transcript_1_1_Confidence_1.000_Length_460::g.26014::m.26014
MARYGHSRVGNKGDMIHSRRTERRSVRGTWQTVMIHIEFGDLVSVARIQDAQVGEPVPLWAENDSRCSVTPSPTLLGITHPPLSSSPSPPPPSTSHLPQVPWFMFTLI